MGDLYDERVLIKKLDQENISMQNSGRIKQVAANLGADVIHGSNAKGLVRQQRRTSPHRAAIESVIDHLKHDCGMRRCCLSGAKGAAIHAVLPRGGLLSSTRLPKDGFAWVEGG